MLPLFSTTERDPLWRREMRERWRRPITLFFLTLYVAGLCWFAYSLYASLVPNPEIDLNQETRGLGHQLFISLLGVQIAIWVPTALMIAAPTISAERERRAIIEYFLAGLLPHQIVRAKFASIATFITVMCTVPVPILALCFPLGGVEPLELVSGVVFEIAVAIICASVGLWISVTSRRVASAMQIAIVVSLISLFMTAILLPPFLNVHFTAWLVTAVGMLFVAFTIITGCEAILGYISRQLEQEERGYQSAPSYTSAPTPTAPIIPTPRPKPAPSPVQSVAVAATSPAKAAPSIAASTRQKLEADLLEGSSWDSWIEKLASYNAITLREVRVGLRASRLRMALSPDSPTYQFSPLAWLAIGLCGAILVWATDTGVWWYFSLVLVTIGATIAAASGASASFTREREQKMFAQLRLCPMSSLEIVTGKLSAMLLLVIRSWGGPLLGLFVAGLSQGVELAITATLLVTLGLLFVVIVATALSLVCHHTSIATIGTLGAVLILFLLLPAAPSTIMFFFPALRIVLETFPLGPMWIEPVHVLLENPAYSLTANSLSRPEAVLRIVTSLVTINALLILISTRTWSRTSPDEGEAKTRFWERDISRSLR